jgi:hypothetical protein
MLELHPDGKGLGWLTGRDQRVCGKSKPDKLFQMIVIVFATNGPPILKYLFDDQLDIRQAGKGYLFTNL